jgi:hypothetical protein
MSQLTRTASSAPRSRQKWEGVVKAEGWYRDPYLVHQDRWFSAGQPTELVRDDGTEGNDPPPPGPPKEDLVEIPDSEPADGGRDLLRADGPSAEREDDYEKFEEKANRSSGAIRADVAWNAPGDSQLSS